LKLDIYIGELRIENVESVVLPTKEKPLWVITYSGGKVVCASEGAKVGLKVVEP
jgi:hypothetical protein